MAPKLCPILLIDINDCNLKPPYFMSEGVISQGATLSGNRDGVPSVEAVKVADAAL